MRDPNYAPVYCALYPELAEIAREHGYAMSIHGSMARDFDLVCIPWIEAPAEPDDVIDAIVKKFAIRRHYGGWHSKEHGRRVHTLVIAFGECAIDLSFMPRLWEPVD
jgi:hypothetical protein